MWERKYFQSSMRPNSQLNSNSCDYIPRQEWGKSVIICRCVCQCLCMYCHHQCQSCTRKKIEPTPQKSLSQSKAICSKKWVLVTHHALHSITNFSCIQHSCIMNDMILLKASNRNGGFIYIE